MEVTTQGHGAAGDLSWPLRQAAELHGDRTAIVDGERTVTYRELARRIGSLGAALNGLDVSAGGRIGFLGVNSLAHVECVIGVPAYGRILVDLNFRLAEAELAFMADDCELEVLVVDREQLPVARRLRERCASLRELVFDDPGTCPDDCTPYEVLTAAAPIEPPGVAEHQIAMISYTGGTTGAPKGVMLSHANLLANARHNLISTGHTAADRWLHACPMFHVAGTAHIFACTWVGARQVILPRFAAASVIAAIEREQITHTTLVPTMYGMLLDELERRPEVTLSSLRHLQYAASPISAELQRRLLARFDCDVSEFYGMTEAAPTVSQLTPADHRRGADAGHLMSIGRPVIGVQAEVRWPDGRRRAANEVGELWVRGPNVMLGYWRRPEATAAALAGGWYRTGDAARCDEDGYLFLVDRLKDMIITGGENVYSIEVEQSLLSDARVTEAAVFGIPDPRWGEAVHAVVCVRPDRRPTPEELIAHCRTRLAGYKVPRSIEIRVAPLPKSGAGKLLKHVLREPYWAGRDRQIN